jgi:hypothetical protein
MSPETMQISPDLGWTFRVFSPLTFDLGGLESKPLSGEEGRHAHRLEALLKVPAPLFRRRRRWPAAVAPPCRRRGSAVSAAQVVSPEIALASFLSLSFCVVRGK